MVYIGETCYCVSHSVISDSLQPQGLWAHQALLSMKVGCHSLLQEIFLTQGLNLGLLHCRWVLYHLSYKGNPKMCLVRSGIITPNFIANLLSREALWCWLNHSNSVARSTTQDVCWAPVKTTSTSIPSRTPVSQGLDTAAPEASPGSHLSIQLPFRFLLETWGLQKYNYSTVYLIETFLGKDDCFCFLAHGPAQKHMTVTQRNPLPQSTAVLKVPLGRSCQGVSEGKWAFWIFFW